MYQTEMLTGATNGTFSLMHVGEEVKCAEWGIQMINKWIAVSSGTLWGVSCPSTHFQAELPPDRLRKKTPRGKKTLQCPQQPVCSFRHFPLRGHYLAQQYLVMGLVVTSVSMRFWSSEKGSHSPAFLLSDFRKNMWVPWEVLLPIPA